MDTNEIQNKLETLKSQLEKYDIDAVVTGEQYEHENRSERKAQARETVKFIGIYLSQGRQIKAGLLRDLEAALEATK